jgi:hypothetical protein
VISPISANAPLEEDENNSHPSPPAIDTKPQSQQLAPTLSSSSPSQQLDNLASILVNGSIQIHIRAYEKRGEGINAFIVYKIETKVKQYNLFKFN